MTKSSLEMVRMFILMMFRMRMNLGHFGSKTRSVGQIGEITVLLTRGHIFDPDFMKCCQNVCLGNV